MSDLPSGWRFRKQPHEIRSLLPARGACMASARILVDGAPVGYAYREIPDFPEDSGWRFFAGDETSEYCEDASNFAYFDCNTIFNYDPGIEGLLDQPVGSKFTRDKATLSWQRE